MNFLITHPENLGGMNERIRRLRQQNFDTPTTLSIERALIETEFYKKYYGTMPTPVLRARNFYEICKKKTIYIGTDELIVGERGPVPKAVPTFPELTTSRSRTLTPTSAKSYPTGQARHNANVSSTTSRRSGKKPITLVCSLNLWSSVPPVIPLWTARCITRDCST